ncbi:DUF6160 family protein [Marinobacter sp. TBZ242]|uniref:DUF6160 family protein n=1 Tax=Marinobacter azerbaijanicus TaxID=3050455 RepID=A0ABT7I6C7_9GAMM|nr:DUF6160 family protein [Marinobacter sp. TBZ242]MDL0429654.1 DUF6160 family protein [Marinobacter sp. TBZ242]
MKGLKKVALVTAISAASFGAQAEMQALDDSTMSNMTGQAGVTIELDANVSIGEIQYKDQGSLFMSDIAIGGAGLNGHTYADGTAAGTALDNLKIDIDIAGDGTDLGQSYGLAKINDPDVVEVANTGIQVPTDPLTGAAVGGQGEVAPTIDDGDLVIALDAIDQNDGVDLALNVGEVRLGDSSQGVNETTGAYTTGTGTVLLSNLRMNGQIGPIDIVIDGTTSNMNVNAYFQAGGQVTMPFMATSLGFKIHNGRGDDQLIYTNSRGDVAAFAHAQVDISPNADTTKGLNVNVQDFSGDIDLTNITLGTAPSIGSVYLTDLSVRADMNVYGH